MTESTVNLAAACLADAGLPALPLHLVQPGDVDAWAAGRPPLERRWLGEAAPAPKAGTTLLLPATDGGLAGAVHVLDPLATAWDVAAARASLPAGTVWRLDGPAAAAIDHAPAGLAWALDAYRFERYRPGETASARLQLADDAARRRVSDIVSAVAGARDLVNTPANDLGPAELELAVRVVARHHDATLQVVRGEALELGFPLVHAVGAASPRPPRLLDLRWGDPAAPAITLVGKGVCFDTGGLDIKPSAGMLLMRKDMGGAALMLALAQSVMALHLRVRLRLLIPTADNSIAGNAFRPGDVFRSRQGLTVEIGNTDAEGRLLLADAMAYAQEDGAPALLLDAATLTGAARVALGPELPALFTPDDTLAGDLLTAGLVVGEPLWRLPLHAPYASYLRSPVADINNSGAKPLAGAITAALFLQRFVSTPAWAHLDTFCWNDEARPGRPKGGEINGFHAALAMLERRFAGPPA